ncbi:hypothetical protein KAU09_02650 [Candidatus Parcubacteria bacterium]|nr:hypothetical protein [Candidatus Parcubacteria bacterium]
MKIESIPKVNDSYKFRVDDVIILEITGSMIPALEIVMPSSGSDKKFQSRIREQFDIEKMINDLLNKNNKIKKIVIKNGACHVDDETVFQISELEKYKI